MYKIFITQLATSVQGCIKNIFFNSILAGLCLSSMQWWITWIISPHVASV